MKLLLSLCATLFLLSFLASADADEPVRGRIPSVHVTSMHQWVVGRMMAWMPPGKSMVKDAVEDPGEGKARYEEIADDLISVVFDPSEKPIFSGPHGRSKTLAILLSIAFFESGFRKDVDRGVGSLSKGDFGQSWCLMQIMLGKPDPRTGDTRRRIALNNKYFTFTKAAGEGFGGLDLVRDRKTCFRVGLHLVRNSFDKSSSLPLYDRLSIYASGSAVRDFDVSKHRVKKAQTWLAQDPPPLDDSSVLDILHPSAPTPSPGPGAPVRKPPDASPRGA